MQGYIQDCLDVGHSNGPRSGLFSIFTATFLVMGLSFVLVPELTKTGMFGHEPHLAAEDRLLWQLIGAAIATVVSPVACTQQVNAIADPASDTPSLELQACSSNIPSPAQHHHASLLIATLSIAAWPCSKAWTICAYFAVCA